MPGHFYNVRIIAVGVNNFQSGSKVLRLSTLTKAGLPYQGDEPPPPSQDDDDDDSSDDDDDDDSDSNDDSPPGRGSIVEVQAANLPESVPVITRESSGGYSGGGGGGGGSQSSQRRSTGSKKHSTPTLAVDQAAHDLATANQPEESMQQLTEKFEIIRRETDETVVQIVREREEFERKFSEMLCERDEKKHALQERERASKSLKTEVDSSDRLNRIAQGKKAQQDKKLKDVKAKREKMLGDMTRWKQEIESMKSERESWKKEIGDFGKKKEAKVAEITESIAKKQLVLDNLEKEIQTRGLEIVELEAERRKLPGSEDDEESQARDAADKQEEVEWLAQERQILSSLNIKSQQLRELEILTSQHQSTLAALQATYELTVHANASGVDYDLAGAGKAKSRRVRSRKSRTKTLSSSLSAHAADSPFTPANAYSSFHNTASTPFAPGPYFGHNDTGMVIEADHASGMSEEETRMLTADAPLSPTAHSLLPSNIFNDDLDDDHQQYFGNIGTALDTEPQSPGSSNPSVSFVASPRSSSQNLTQYGVPIQDFSNEDEHRSMNSQMAGSTASPEPAGHKSLKNLFTRTRGKSIGDGLSLGSLKPGQSQSFPLSTEEPDSHAPKPRRISFSSNWPNFFKGTPASDSLIPGNGPAPARNSVSRPRRSLKGFASSMDESDVLSERDPSSPRPTSIASSDLPRPSTDSAPFGWGVAPDGLLPNRHSPLATNWSVHVPQIWPSNPSRRPSLQKGSSATLNTGIASEDDEFLPSSESFGGNACPLPVGVIGTRPSTSPKPINPKLNPAAPAFSVFNFGRTSKTDKDKARGKGKAFEITPTPVEPVHDVVDAFSPVALSKSRDTISIHTQNSVAESHESLDRTTSSTTSDLNHPSSASAKEKDTTTLRSLLRKGSSSKFSISLRGKENSLFSSSKKGMGSNPSSDRGDHRDSSLDEFGEDIAVLGRSVDSAMSSPMLGSGDWKGKEKDPGTPKEGKVGRNWGMFGLKKGKGRTSEDVERTEAEIAWDEA